MSSAGETILIFFSKHSPTCGKVFAQLNYIRENMPSVYMYDIDDPKTREMLVSYEPFQTVPAMILINHTTNRVEIYQDENAKELISKAVQIINNQKTQEVQRKQQQQQMVTPVNQIDGVQTNDPTASANLRFQPSSIPQTSHDEMARTTVLPDVAPDRTTNIKKSKVFGEDPSFKPAGTLQKTDDLNMQDILGNQTGAIASKAKTEKSNAIKSMAEEIAMGRDAMLEQENLGRRPAAGI
jgi:hypothetical protein